MRPRLTSASHTTTPDSSPRGCTGTGPAPPARQPTITPTRPPSTPQTAAAPHHTPGAARRALGLRPQAAVGDRRLPDPVTSRSPNPARHRRRQTPPEEWQSLKGTTASQIDSGDIVLRPSLYDSLTSEKSPGTFRSFLEPYLCQRSPLSSLKAISRCHWTLCGGWIVSVWGES